MLVNVNGNPYTTAAEDMRIKEFQRAVRELIARQVTAAMQSARSGRLQISMGEIDDAVARIYYAGRDASK